MAVIIHKEELRANSYPLQYASFLIYPSTLNTPRLYVRVRMVLPHGLTPRGQGAGGFTIFHFLFTILPMIITYLGFEAFKIQFGETVIAVNPVSKNSKHKSSRFGADIALVSLNDKDFNGLENVKHGEREPFAITGPGEYEIKGIFIKGFKGESRYNLPANSKESRINTIYSISLEGMNLCFLGALDSKDLLGENKEALDDIDVLFVPVGGEGVISSAQAYELAVKLEPRLIIPSHFENTSDKNLKVFLKEVGEEGTKPVEKLTLKKKDLEGKEG